MPGPHTSASALHQRFGANPFRGNLSDMIAQAIPLLSIVLTAIIGIGAILAGLTGDDSESPGLPLPGDPVEVSQMRTELLLAINDARNREELAPVDFGLERHTRAQEWAMRNAVTGEEDNSPEQVVMIQAHMPTESASAQNFLDWWMSSDPHKQVLLKPEYSTIGIGVAEHEGTTWAVVQFTLE